MLRLRSVFLTSFTGLCAGLGFVASGALIIDASFMSAHACGAGSHCGSRGGSVAAVHAKGGFKGGSFSATHQRGLHRSHLSTTHLRALSRANGSYVGQRQGAYLNHGHNNHVHNGLNNLSLRHRQILARSYGTHNGHRYGTRGTRYGYGYGYGGYGSTVYHSPIAPVIYNQAHIPFYGVPSVMDLPVVMGMYPQPAAEPVMYSLHKNGKVTRRVLSSTSRGAKVIHKDGSVSAHAATQDTDHAQSHGSRIIYVR